MAKLKKGQRVRHVGRPDWGVGQLLEDETDAAIRVFFTGADEKTMAPGFRDRLAVVAGSEAHSTLLDNLDLPEGPTVSRPMVTLALAKERFLELFPGGFYGTKFLEHERLYKERLRDYCADLLGRDVLTKLVADKEYAEVVERTRKFLRHKDLNLLSQFEKMDFSDGTARLANAEAFAVGLRDWMYSEKTVDQRLDIFARVLKEISCDKWPILTSFTFFGSPKTEVMIKPVNLQRAAKLCRFEINYRPELNALTLDSVSNFYRYLWDELTELEPRDMIDVQSFIWCIDPETYGA